MCSVCKTRQPLGLLVLWHECTVGQPQELVNHFNKVAYAQPHTWPSVSRQINSYPTGISSAIGQNIAFLGPVIQIKYTGELPAIKII